MRASQVLTIIVALVSLSLPSCNTHDDQSEGEEHHTIVVTSPKVKDVTITQQYVCQIHSQNHIQIRAYDDGYLQEIGVKEGQLVKKDHSMFKILPTIYKAKWETEKAEVKIARLELDYAEKLNLKQGISENEVLLYKAKLKRAEAKAALAEAEYSFTDIKAPFDGIVGRRLEQLGSLIKERDILTTLSDNSVMWVYFNVPEARYYEYQRSSDQEKADQRIKLMLADGSEFKYPGDFRPLDPVNPAGAIESTFNNANGNGSFRVDFRNPERLLRHGMTGTILIHRPRRNALVIPQRATFEILDRRYVFVVDEKEMVHQREIVVDHEMDDIYVIKKGLSVGDRFVYEGIRQVRDGQKIEEYELRPPEQILGHQTLHAE